MPLSFFSRHSPSSRSSTPPLLYIQPIWATLLGWAVFDHLPGRWAVLGMRIVGAAGLSLFWRGARL